MKAYVVEEYLDDYPENGGGYQGVACILDSREKAEEYCKPDCLFEDYEAVEGETYYRWFECEVR